MNSILLGEKVTSLLLDVVDFIMTALFGLIAKIGCLSVTSRYGKKKKKKDLALKRPPFVFSGFQKQRASFENFWYLLPSTQVKEQIIEYFGVQHPFKTNENFYFRSSKMNSILLDCHMRSIQSNVQNVESLIEFMFEKQIFEKKFPVLF